MRRKRLALGLVAAGVAVGAIASTVEAVGVTAVPDRGATAEKKFTVVIDAGHGGKDPGALGAITNEKSINLSVALKLGEAIAERCKDVTVIQTRKTDRFVDLDERAGIANRNKADLFISIHANALKAKAIAGAETYTLGLARTNENLQVAMRENAAILLEDDYARKYEGFNPNSSESYIIFEMMQNIHIDQSLRFASEVQRCFKTAGRVDRGVRQAGFLVLRKTGMPSVLVELGYISNREEEKYMASAAGQKRLVKALCDAFVHFKEDFDRKSVAAKAKPDAKQDVKSDAVATAKPVTEKPKSDVAKPKADVVTAKPEVADKPKLDEPQTQTAAGKIFKVQICTSNRLLKADSPALKGYPLSYYEEKGLYKYTVGETNDSKEILSTLKKVRQDFPSAFVVTFEDGKRVK